MRVLYSLDPPAPLGRAVLGVSLFDGVHRGHQRLVKRVAELAAALEARPVAVTFWPHPQALAGGEASSVLLSTLEEKLALLAGLGALEATVVLPPTQTEAEQQAGWLPGVSAWCTPAALVVGADVAAHDGAENGGALRDWAQHGEEPGISMELVEARVGDEVISSAGILGLVEGGQVEGAARLLGRPYRLMGEVVPGDRRGRLLGFPTANLRLDQHKALPARGVYAVRVRLPGEAHALHSGVANIGVRPTFSGEPRLLVEVHLLDATMDLYGLRLGVELVARLREERRFEGIEALTTQIARDAQAARELLRMQAHGAGTGQDTENRSEAPWAC